MLDITTLLASVLQIDQKSVISLFSKNKLHLTSSLSNSFKEGLRHKHNKNSERFTTMQTIRTLKAYLPTNAADNPFYILDKLSFWL